MAREGLDVLVIEKAGLGGQVGITRTLDNFPGFHESISGAEFADRLVLQARRFGVEVMQAQEVSALRQNGDYWEVDTSDGQCY
jgi:thioredoxin reductase (NADPH)